MMNNNVYYEFIFHRFTYEKLLQIKKICHIKPTGNSFQKFGLAYVCDKNYFSFINNGNFTSKIDDSSFILNCLSCYFSHLNNHTDSHYHLNNYNHSPLFTDKQLEIIRNYFTVFKMFNYFTKIKIKTIFQHYENQCGKPFLFTWGETVNDSTKEKYIQSLLQLKQIAMELLGDDYQSILLMIFDNKELIELGIIEDISSINLDYSTFELFILQNEMTEFFEEKWFQTAMERHIENYLHAHNKNRNDCQSFLQKLSINNILNYLIKTNNKPLLLKLFNHDFDKNDNAHSAIAASRTSSAIANIETNKQEIFEFQKNCFNTFFNTQSSFNEDWNYVIQEGLDIAKNLLELAINKQKFTIENKNTEYEDNLETNIAVGKPIDCTFNIVFPHLIAFLYLTNNPQFKVEPKFNLTLIINSLYDLFFDTTYRLNNNTRTKYDYPLIWSVSIMSFNERKLLATALSELWNFIIKDPIWTTQEMNSTVIHLATVLLQFYWIGGQEFQQLGDSIVPYLLVKEEQQIQNAIDTSINNHKATNDFIYI